ncbi:hypothetical protein TB2_035328 [Malus domestica]
MGSSGHEKGAMRTPEQKLPTWISASSFGASSSASSCASSSTANNDVTKSDTEEGFEELPWPSCRMGKAAAALPERWPRRLQKNTAGFLTTLNPNISAASSIYAHGPARKCLK